jgi:hypothetical protein
MINTPENQAPSELPSQNIFANLIGGPELHVHDWQILDHIISNGKKIKGLAEYLLYVRFILKKSTGKINRPQWHSRATIMDIVGMRDNHFPRYEQQWLQDGWLMKSEGGGRETSKRALGWQFNHIRIGFYNPIQIESSTPSQFGSSTPSQFGSSPPSKFGNSPPSQFGEPNPNNLNPNDFNPNDLKPNNGGGNNNNDQTNEVDKKDPPPPLKREKLSLSESKAGDIFDELRDLKKLRNRKPEYAADRSGWIKIIQDVWGCSQTEQIKAEMDLICRMRGSIPKDAKMIRKAISDAQTLSFEDKPKQKSHAEYMQELEEHKAYIEENGSFDDMPF